MTPTPSNKVSPSENLHTLWEQFVQAASPSYEKSRWMDIFLSEFLTQLRDGKNIQEILSFCTPGLAGTLLSCELLSDVHQLCQQPGQHEDDTRPLQKFLLEGRGTRCLLALHALGTQGISCGRELAGLLISLYPICLQTPIKEADTRKNQFLSLSSENDLENILKVKSHARAKGWSLGSLNPRLSNGSVSSSTRFRRKRSSTGSAAPPLSASSESGEEIETEGDLSPLAPTLRIQLNPMDFDYFTSVVRSEDEGERRRSERALNPEDFVHEGITAAMTTKLSVYELCRLIVSLVNKLCLSEPLDSSQTSVQAINLALENLCSLQFGAVNLGCCEQSSELKCSLISLLLTSLERSLQHSDSTATVMHSGMLPVLLRVLEDAVRKAGLSQDETNPNPKEISNNHDFIFATMHGALTFLYSLLQQHEKFRDFMELFRLLSESQGGRLIENSVTILIKTPHISSNIAISRAKKVVNLVGLMVGSLKKARAAMVHSRQCKRPRHKQCGVKERFHHHDLMGQAYSAMSNTCSVASMFVVLLRVSQNCGNAEVQLRAARAMAQCGACCCLPPRTLLLPALELATSADLRIRAAALSLMEKVLFCELGGSVESTTCVGCGTKTLPLLLSDYSPEDTALSSPRGSVSSVQDEPAKNLWGCLEAYKDLLESPNVQLSVKIADHLFKIIPSTSINVKRELLFKVFYPTFLNQKTKYFENDDDETSKFLMQCSLSVLSSQLCNVSFAEEFIIRSGLDHILQLITLPDFSKSCCSILEVTVVIELWRQETRDEKGESPSLDMLTRALETSTAALMSSLQRLATRQQRKEKAEGQPGPSRESDSGCLTEHDSSETKPDNVLAVPTKHVLVQQLGSAVVFWRACASLVSCSPQYRGHLASQDLSTQAHRLLQLVVRQAVRGPARGDEEYSKGSEAYLTLRLLEALITVCLGVHLPACQAADQEHDGAACGGSDVLSSVRQAVLALKPQGRTHVQALCDMLLRCAATHYYEHQVLPARSKPELPAPPSSLGDGGVSSPLEGEECEGGSSLDDSYLTADEGYEADVEIPEGVAESTVESFLMEDALSPLLVHHRGGISAVSRPELCCLVLSLLVQLHEEDPHTLSSSLVHALQRLSSLCRDSPHNCVTLAKHGVIATLLSGFAGCLRVRSPQQGELQRAILELVSLLARYRVLPNELALYLDFFKAPDPPCDALLWPLVNLASCSRPQPHFIMCFPVETGSPIEGSRTGKEAEVLANELHSRHRKAGTSSAWASAPLALPLNQSLGWSMWTHGFSLALWLRLEGTPRDVPSIFRTVSPRHSTTSCSSDSATSDWNMLGLGSSRGSLTDSMKSAQSGGSERLLHVFSVGGESLTLEGWTEPCSELLCLRLCRSDNATYEVLAESVIDKCLPRGQWHHLAINVTDRMQNKRTVVEVAVIIDGCKEVKVQLSFGGLLLRKSRPSCLLLGHATAAKSNCSGAWFLGGAMLFRSPVFTRERAMHLAGLGPNHTNLTECEATKARPNFSSLFSHKTVGSGLSWEAVLEGASGNLKLLQDNLLLTYSAQNCNVVQIYPLVVTSPGGAVGSLFPPAQSGFRVVATEQRASQQVPLSLTPVCLLGEGKSIEAQHFQGLAAATTLLGGIQVFLVLFARVVELECSEGEQAQALSLLLKLAQADAELFSQLADCHKLLLRVLESPRCKAGPLVLKSLLDACCDRSLIPLQLPGGEIAVSHNADSLVTNSFLLATGVRAWRAWDAAALSCLFGALHALLRDDHPYREFNAAQLNRVRLVETLLLFCKEKFLYEDKEESGPQLPPSVSCSLVELVRSLMGAPPEFCHVVAVADFLLLLHRASATYVSHARSNFYFLLCPDDQNKQGPYINTNSECRRPKIELAQPIDPLKLNKALTNLHIKQNGNENRESEQQDTTAELESLDSNRVEEEQDSSVEQSGMNGINSLVYSNDSGLSFYPSIAEDEGQGHKDEQWEKFNSEAGGLKEWEGEKASSQSLVVEGLLLLLRDTLLVLPDSMSHQVLNHVVRAEMLLAMANHSDSRVRTAVVRVLSAYLQRATDEEVNKFLKMKGFYLLANQLSQFEASAELVEACVALVTKCQVSLEEQTELWSLREMSSLQVASFPPLLALLPRSVSDTALCHNAVFFLREVVTKVPQSYRPLLECGLLEALGRTLLAVAHLPPDPSDLCGVSEQDLIIGDIYVFLVTIIGRAISQPGSLNLQVVSEVLLLLSYLERQERLRCGWPSRCSQALRDAQCAVLEGALDRLQERGSTVSQPATNRPKPSASFLAAMLTSSSDDGGLGPTIALSAQQVLSLSGQLKDVPRGEVNERLKLLLTKAVEFLVTIEPVGGQYRVSECEAGFARSLLMLLVHALASTLEKQPRAAARSPWQGAVWAGRDTVRVLTGQLLVFLLSPRHPLRMRTFVVHSLHAEPRCRELLAGMLQANSQVEHRFSVFFRDLLVPHRNLPLTSADTRVCEGLLGRLHSWALLCPRPGPPEPAVWAEELTLLHEDYDRGRVASIKQQEAAQMRNLLKQESLAKSVAESAMLATRAAVEAQNGERKAFMEHIKAVHSESVQLRAHWHHIVQQLTHERAVWFFPDSYPRSWRLDATEGPGRVRNRLQRCHLGIKERYLMPEYQHKLEALECPAPLSFLFEQEGRGNSSVLIERLHTNEKIRHMSAVQVVTPAQEVPGELLVGETCLYFVSDELEAGLDEASQAWLFEDVREIHQRRFQLQERAVEIFLTNGKTYFVAFKAAKERDDFMQVVSQCPLPNIQPAEALSDVMQLWREGLISNFEYLSQLNKMSGRSFNDLMQYPVFPFVLADYTSSRIDLANPAVYRNFEKPMAVQDKKNEQHYINTYNYLKQELQGGMSTISLNQEPFHYGSHYSNSGTVLHFLVRMPPFTRMFLTYQDNNFDIPDRTFHSLHTTWRLTSSDSTTDVKELIPEFFFLPEFLLNAEGFSLGVRQSGERVHHVQMPPWCEADPRHFVLAHRQALESDYVRENLPHWVDLVFGYKQTGKPAVDSINVFHPATYYGFDVESIKDPLERIAWETMVRTYGQTPRQLFRAPHPMVIQSLATKEGTKATSGVILPLGGTVLNLRWGNYVGSPAEGEPRVAWRHAHRTPVAGLVPLRTNDVFGLAPCTSLLLAHQGRGGLLGTPVVQGAALVSWGHADGVVRAKMRKEQPPRPLAQAPGVDPVLLCASAPDLPQLWIALSSGRLLVLRLNFQPSRGVLESRGPPSQLLGHSAPVLSLALCRAFSIAVSASQDGSAIVWDLNTLSYVRTIPSAGVPVQLVAVSDVSGDIVTSGPISAEGGGSCLRLYTVNAALVGKVACEEQICALCFSCAPEGLAVNVVAAGLATGDVKMWNTWDLSPVRKISCDFLNSPIISLVYSHDAQHLYASAADGTVVIWEAAGARGKTAKFLNLTSL